MRVGPSSMAGAAASGGRARARACACAPPARAAHAHAQGEGRVVVREARVRVESDGWDTATVAGFAGRKVGSWSHLGALFPCADRERVAASSPGPVCLREGGEGEAGDVVLFWSPAEALDGASALRRMVAGEEAGWRDAWARFPGLARRLGLSDYARKLPVWAPGEATARKERLKASEASRLVEEPAPLPGALSVAFGATRSGEDNVNLSTMLADPEGREFCEHVLRPTLLAQGEALEQVAPRRARAMRDAVAQSGRGVLGVPHFETVAISVNHALRFHRDVHDLGEGLSCMLCLHGGVEAVHGGELVVPGLAADERGARGECETGGNGGGGGGATREAPLGAYVLPMPHGAVTMFQAHRLWHATMPVGMPAQDPDACRIQLISLCKERKG